MLSEILRVPIDKAYRAEVKNLNSDQVD
jgi:hypothetical protein